MRLPWQRRARARRASSQTSATPPTSPSVKRGRPPFHLFRSPPPLPEAKVGREARERRCGARDRERACTLGHSVGAGCPPPLPVASPLIELHTRRRVLYRCLWLALSFSLSLSLFLSRPLSRYLLTHIYLYIYIYIYIY